MKKEVDRGSSKYGIVFLVLLFALGFLVFGLIGKFSEVPFLSPLFPGFAPFDASVSIFLGNFPVISDLDPEIFVCEGNSTNHYFNVTDLDADLFIVRVSDPPPIPLFAEIVTFPGFGEVRYDTRLFSGITDKADVGVHGETIFAIDQLNNVDAQAVDLEVIEINNPPVVDTIGVQTFVWLQGEDSTFDIQAVVDDVEDGTQDDGIVIFDLSFLNYADQFNISANGTMFFDPNVSLNFSSITLPFVMDLQMCVLDTALPSPHSRIDEFCYQDGSAFNVCQNFSLTVTDENRAPIITSFYPFNLTFSTAGDSGRTFNITARDPDGTIPDVYWYVDDIFQRYDSMVNFSELTHTFACGVDGEHSVRVDVTDGLLNDTLAWNISVGFVACPSSESSGGGGGGGARTIGCEEEWGCLNWNVCQNVEISLEQGLIGKEDYSNINQNCDLDRISGNCGFQLRECVDVIGCNSTKDKPEEVQHCYYVEDPSCSDGIKNCHSGSCEVLVDCGGGACGACATCSDGIQNQGEEGKDCGGACPSICPEKLPLNLRFVFLWGLIGIVVILLIIVGVQIVRIYLNRDRGTGKKIIVPVAR
jgi:hypothetical protein